MTAAQTAGRANLEERLVSISRELGPFLAAADVTVVSVPIEVTDAVIARVGPHVREDALLMDVTSVKRGPVSAMLEATRGSVVGTHPMFGASVHSLQGQRVVLCGRGTGEERAQWFLPVGSAAGVPADVGVGRPSARRSGHVVGLQWSQRAVRADVAALSGGAAELRS